MFNNESNMEKIFKSSELNRIRTERDKLKLQRDSLLEALKEIAELFPNNPKLPISHQVLEIAKEAIEKATKL